MWITKYIFTRLLCLGLDFSRLYQPCSSYKYLYLNTNQAWYAKNTNAFFKSTTLPILYKDNITILIIFEAKIVRLD